MKEELKVGTIIKFDEESDKSYLIVRETEYNRQKYFLLNSFNDKSEEKIEISLKNMLLAKLNKDGELEFVDDKELATRIAKKLIEEEK